MTLGWQGFSIEHPDDWAPVQLKGNRDEGYIRIASTSRLACQLRWKKSANPGELTSRLRGYLARLERDARKAKASFDADLEQEDGRLAYHYRGSSFGRGTLFHEPSSQRVFFLEVISPKNESMLGLHRQIADSFQTDELDRWAILGLDVSLPKGLKVERTVLEAGHIRVDLAGRGVKAMAERWGFGEQLVAKHGLEAWAREVIRMPKAKLSTEAEGIRLIQRGLKPSSALIAFQPDRNQLTVLHVRSRSAVWTPRWEWIR